MLIKKIKYKKIILPSAILLLAAFIFLNKPAYADQNCSNLDGDTRNQCEELEKKAKLYQQIIELKNKQQDTLSAQMKSIDEEQAQNLTELQRAQKNAADLTTQVKSLEEDINDLQVVVDGQKKILAGLMRSYYEYDQGGVLGLVVLDQNLSDIFSQSDYIEQSGAKASDVLADVVKTKNELEATQKELIQKKQESDNVKDMLANKKADLLDTEAQKQDLMEKTQGEEAKYKDLLANVEEQKKELFNFSTASNIDELNASVSSYPKPSDHLASTSWYFSQKDSRWGSQRIGTSSSLMKDYGCAVTCVAMVFRKMGSSIDPGRMAKQKIFSVDLIKWPTSWDPGIALSSSISHGNINWATVDKQIAKGNPVIVYIKKTNGTGGHYVVVTGKDSKDYIVHDPYFGANLYLSTSKSLVGKIGIDSGVRIDQMIVYN